MLYEKRSFARMPKQFRYPLKKIRSLILVIKACPAPYEWIEQGIGKAIGGSHSVPHPTVTVCPAIVFMGLTRPV